MESHLHQSRTMELHNCRNPRLEALQEDLRIQLRRSPDVLESHHTRRLNLETATKEKSPGTVRETETLVQVDTRVSFWHADSGFCSFEGGGAVTSGGTAPRGSAAQNRVGLGSPIASSLTRSASILLTSVVRLFNEYRPPSSRRRVGEGRRRVETDSGVAQVRVTAA